MERRQSNKVNNMEKCNLWTIISKDAFPEGRKLISNKWFFKEKRDGSFRARLVALGYLQIPGVYFIENFSLVVDNSSFKVTLLLIQKLNLPAWSLDVETAFINGNLEGDLNMKISKGHEWYGKTQGQILKLNISIYGLVQAARQWHKKFEEEILKLRYLKNEVDPCIFLNIDKCKFCLLCIYVDNGILTGDVSMMDETIRGLEKVFNIKTNKGIEDFLGCKIKESTNGMMLTQKRIIEKSLKITSQSMMIKLIKYRHPLDSLW
jgi:hypothetical protein